MTEVAKTPLFIRLDVEALEDLHTGTGTGSGDIDALVQRDRNGRPVIRASHFKGLLREAGEELIALGTSAIDKRKLDELLGEPGGARGALRMTSLRTREEVATLIWGSTKRVEGGRAPEEDTLRFVEHVAGGTRFTAQLRLSDQTFQPLLERLLNRVDRIGGDRNRGSGLVKLDWQPGALPNREPPMDTEGPRLRLILRNLEPLCLPATGHPGNLIRSHSFIRGQTLRGALIAWAIHAGRPQCLALFGRVSVGDALPLPYPDQAVDRVLPIPLSILTKKPQAANADAPWWAEGSSEPVAFDSLGEKREPEEKPKRPGVHEYLCRVGDTGPWLRYTPTMEVRLRNATPKRDSKKKEAELFSLEEIAEDTRFQAELRFDDEPAAQDFIGVFAPLLAGCDWLAIGRGGQPAFVESITAAQDPPSKDVGDDWILTLVSDLIVRGEHLGFLDGLDLGRLCQWAGVAPQDGWRIEQALVEPEAIHGFNAVTGLRRAPALAIRRGSCWRITGAGSAKLAKALREKGALGERVGEGFGRFLVDAQPIREPGRPASEEGEPVANRNEELLALARQLAGKIAPGGPSLSQLQWLRERALAARDDQDLDALLTEIEEAPERRRQGGQPWQAFRSLHLRQEVGKLQNLGEKRQLISYLVQWRVPKAKEKRG